MQWTIKYRDGHTETFADVTLYAEYSGHYGTTFAEILAEAIEQWIARG